LSKLFDAWYMNTGADSIPVDADEEPPGTDLEDRDRAAATPDQVELTPSVQLHGLHAKLFVSDDGWYSHVWTGSPNATTAAFDAFRPRLVVIDASVASLSARLGS
jgi:phosphatidylserine/phosphatidylglycerophosphate/cardiolipin synthase-like enzyme